jgi:hypothetical protein
VSLNKDFLVEACNVLVVLTEKKILTALKLGFKNKAN